MDKSLELRKNVEADDFMKLAGGKMNLPFNAGPYWLLLAIKSWKWYYCTVLRR